MKTDSEKEELARRNQELFILNRVAQALNHSINLKETLQIVLGQVAELLDLRTGWIWLMAEQSGETYLAAAQNLPPALADDAQKMAGSCFCLNTFREGDLERGSNVSVVKCSRLQALETGTGGLRYHATIPVLAHGRKLGVLNVASTDWRELSAADLQLLQTIGDMLGIAIERARLFSRSAEMGALEERNRLARELHDTLAQGLTAISLQLESADALFDEKDGAAPVKQAVQYALRLARENLVEVRRSVLDLRAAPLAGKQLVEALLTLIEQAALPVDMIVRGGERPLPSRIETAVFRIVQESLHNIHQHAAAALVKIAIFYEPHWLKLEITDDGRGFDPNMIKKGRYGLVGINERVKLLQGEFVIQSSPGSGTRLQIEIPLP